jgi:altronate hydrolase
VYGNKPCPSIKLATNTTMYNKMSEDMDVNCGEIADGNVSVEEKGTEIFRKFLSIASGEPSKSEAQGLGDAEFIPWQVGAVM